MISTALSLPQLFRVRQVFERPRVVDVPGEVERQLSALHLAERIRPGQSVAITVGSRGIANIRFIIKAVVEHMRALGAEPFLVPAMGSHGGATAAGQRQVIEGYGVTEEFCHCPIRSSMETEIICRTSEGIPVYFDRHAFAADHVLVVGRIKPHTDFVGQIESGLMKMMLIGLGKHDGAKIYHRAIHDYNWEQIVRSVAGEVLSRCHIVGGLAIVENGYDETALLEGVMPTQFVEREPELLKMARRWMPRLPFAQVDLLIVDEIGKNISGSGMDTNVTGRKFNDHAATGDELPNVRRIAVRGIAEASHGNGIGIGMAEFCLTRAIEQTDKRATWINGLTSGHVSASMFPLNFDTDREVLDAALPTIGLRNSQEARLLWIKNTLELAEVECSAAFLNEAQQRADLEILSELRAMPLDASGYLPAFLAADNSAP